MDVGHAVRVQVAARALVRDACARGTARQARLLYDAPQPALKIFSFVPEIPK